MMDIPDDWKKAGKIAQKSLSYGKNLVKVGNKYVDVVEKVEDKIISLGGNPGFPVTISVNDIAAHYTPGRDESTIFKRGNLVKLDVGVQVNGYVGDTATTIDLGDNQKLVNASEKALEKALMLVCPGLEIWEIGAVIEEVITTYGFSPVKNLSGHSIERYREHAGISIPNFNNHDKAQLQQGQVIAIEPFATTGIGLIEEKKDSGIYLAGIGGQVRDKISREVFSFIQEAYKTLPFTGRWLYKKFPEFKVRYALRILSRGGIIQEYKQLQEKSKGLVSQAEHTILVSEQPIILTKQ